MANKISMEVVNFRQELKRIEEEVLFQGNLRIHDRIDYATNQLRIVTPVDTGKARKGWYNKKNYSIYGTASGEINNDVEYIEELNRGHSKQAPKYFIEQVLSTIGLITPN